MGVRIIFTLAIFLSSALLFLIQPMVARMVLPTFGGAPGVWSTSQLFFQAVLLAGYGYAHLSTKRLGVKKHLLFHLPLLLIVAVSLPFALPGGGGAVGEANPALKLLKALLLMVGPSFFAVSAGAPVLQRWFASTSDPDAKDPYFLYSASNLGSMVALLAYPLLVEPQLRLKDQALLWAGGYGLLFLCMSVCALIVLRSPAPTAESSAVGEVAQIPDSVPITNPQRLLWIGLAAVPSSLLLGVTNYLSTNVAPIPLLWVIPLALYLLTFIFAFAKRPLVKASWLGRALPILILPISVITILDSAQPLIPLAALHLITFFVAAWMCHSRLSESRPDPKHLTEFYFFMALGGVIGGAFNALAAPEIFRTLAEYPIALVAVCMLRPSISTRKGFDRWDAAYPFAVGLFAIFAIIAVRFGPTMLAHHSVAAVQAGPLRTALTIGIPVILCFIAVDRPLRFGLALGAVFFVAAILNVNTDDRVLRTDRSFFGVHRVVEYGPKMAGSDQLRFVKLVHGTTLHGIQDRMHPEIPLTYYYPNGPAGQVFKAFSGPLKKRHVALVGLGSGSLAAYGEPGQRMTFFEIDPVVRDTATNPKLFTYVSNSKAKVDIVLGDARLSLATQPDHEFGIIVLDAFSSDAIPIHLLTEEAIQMYFRKLEPDGILVIHISNRYLDLAPILYAISKDLHLANRAEEDGPTEEESQKGKTASNYVLLARDKSAFKPLGKIDWETLEPADNVRPWTDDYSNVLGVFKRND